MYNLFKPGTSARSSERDQVALLADRIGSYRNIAARYGAQLIVIVPPIPRPGAEYHEELLKAAALTNVRAFIPMSCGDLPSSDFVDDMHMNLDGSRRFTSKLMREIKPVLAALR